MKTPAKNSNSTTTWLIIGAVVLAAVVAVGVLMFGGGDDKPSADEAVTDDAGVTLTATQDVTVTGEPLPEYDPKLATDPAIGMTAPTLTGQSFDGTPIAIGPDGKNKVVIFLAHWCPHCQEEVPILVDGFDAGTLPDDVSYYAVSTSVNPDAPNYPPYVWLDKENWPTPVLADDKQSSAGMAWGLSSFPYYVFVDGNNVVMGRGSGEVSAEDFALEITGAFAGTSAN